VDGDESPARRATVGAGPAREARARSGTAALPFWAWCVVAVFCTALYTFAVPLSSAAYQVDLVLAFVIATVQCGSLVVAVLRPITGAALQLLSVVALALATRDSGADPWPLPVPGLLSLGALVLLLGLRERWVVSATFWWLSVLVLVVLIAGSPERYADPDGWGTNLTIYATYTVTVLVAAIAVGQRHRIRADLAAARRDVELEHAQRQYVEERARIARELHDVVAHSMSLIHMRALSAPYRLVEATPEMVDQEFSDIARSARAALAEMRQLLGALRSDDEAADLVPQPQLADLDEIADATSRAGTPVQVDLGAGATATGPVVQLTTYRIVQEALSNVVRHAPGAPTTVSVRVDGPALQVTVRNAPPARPPDPVDGTSPDRGGQGLRGMQERVNLHGGRLVTRRTEDGGFVVDATIPAAIHQPSEAP
jgi:signal transduction histidine kinase